MGSLCLEGTVCKPDGPGRELSDQSRWSCERFAMAFFGPDGTLEDRMVCLCAEPGSGRREILTHVLSIVSRLGVQVFRRNFEGSTPDAASRYLARKAREVEKLGTYAVVAFDSLPASDEVWAERQARALRRMSDSGAAVLMSLAPEARQLLDWLPDCRELTSEMLFSSDLSVSGGEIWHELFGYTRAIPRLVKSVALRGDSATKEGTGGLVLLPSYFDALGEVTGLSVRGGLTDEERRLRLGMLLLGSGSREDLAEVAGKASGEVLADIRRYAPLFGISDDLEWFSTLSGTVPNAYAACLRHLLPACALFPDVARQALGILVRRGEYSRVAVLARAPECDEACRSILERAAQFVDIGEVELVRHALSVDGEQDAPRIARLRLVVSAVTDRSPRLGAMEARRLSSETAMDELLIIDSRRVLRGLSLLTPHGASPDTELGRALALHVGALSLMLHGAFTSALGMVTGSFDEDSQDRLSGALLALDHDASYLLAGGVQNGVSERVARAVELLESRVYPGLWGSAALYRMVRMLMTGAADEKCDPAAMAARAERSEDAVVRVVALLVGSLQDIDGNAFARARVRASLAAELAERLGASYLLRVADLLGVVSRHLAGETVEPRISDAAGDDLEVVTSLVLEALAKDARAFLVSPLPDRVPWDALWLLRALCSSAHELAGLMMERMPASWRRVVAASGATERDEGERGAGEREVPPWMGRESGRTTDKERPVRIKLLGGFSMSVSGVHIPDWKLERRNVKPMIEYLILLGGSARRYQLVEQLWPGCDYAVGFSRVYQTTSTIRALVAEADEEVALVSANRTGGEISIDAGIVRCDVDEFRRCARVAVDSSDDIEALEAARSAERLYEGDLYLPSIDATGRVAAIRAELRTLYADAMVEGSAAALRLGYARTSARMAGNALIANDMREDAVITLVRALKACGRDVEADKQRRAYEARMRRANSRRGGSSGGKVEQEPRRGRGAARRRALGDEVPLGCGFGDTVPSAV